MSVAAADAARSIASDPQAQEAAASAGLLVTLAATADGSPNEEAVQMSVLSALAALCADCDACADAALACHAERTVVGAMEALRDVRAVQQCGLRALLGIALHSGRHARRCTGCAALVAAGGVEAALHAIGEHASSGAVVTDAMALLAELLPVEQARPPFVRFSESPLYTLAPVAGPISFPSPVRCLRSRSTIAPCLFCG